MFSIIAILPGVWWYLIVVLICVFLIMMVCIFSYTCRPFVSLYETCLFESFVYFLIWDFFSFSLSCSSSLYMLKINYLLGIWLANIFFDSKIACLFTMLIVSCDVQELFFLIFVFDFVVCGFGVISNKSLPRQISRGFYLFPGFTVSGIMFKSLIHFELNFWYGIRSVSNFILFYFFYIWISPFQ